MQGAAFIREAGLLMLYEMRIFVPGAKRCPSFAKGKGCQKGEFLK